MADISDPANYMPDFSGVGDIGDPANYPASSTNPFGYDPSASYNQPLTGGFDLNKLLKAFTSPAGIAGLGGAALGFLDRPKPSGGGTTMTYPGAAQLQRKMVQGPYGPLAEYTGPGGGAPDYTPFRAPTIAPPPPAAAPAPGAPGTGMSVQAKVDLYKQLAGYGLGPDRIRRIAETMYGPQTDSDWSELTRLAGMTGGIAAVAPTPAPRPATPGVAAPAGPPVTAPNVGSAVMGGPPPAAAPAAPATTLGNYNTRAAADYIKYRKLPGDAGGSASAIKSMLEKDYGPQTQAQLDAYEKAFAEHMAYQSGRPTGIGQQVQDYSPEAKAATYENYLGRGLTDKEIRAMAEKQFGPQKESDWAELQRIAGTLPDDLLPTKGAMPTNIQTEAAVEKYRSPTQVATAPPPPPPAAPEVDMSEGYKYATQPGGIGIAKYYENIADFLRKNPSEEEIRAAMKEYGVSDLDVRRAQIIHALPGKRFAQGGEARAYAGGRPLTMEDGGFVFTKKATDRLGHQGIASLGGKMISAPGNGTDDRGITGIIGKNGVTPARVSNGEAYIPPGHDTKKLYALMNSLERKA